MTPKGAGRRVEWYDRLWPICMDRPVQGVLQISSWPIRNALTQMNW